jgi:hypothetical protein
MGEPLSTLAGAFGLETFEMLLRRITFLFTFCYDFRTLSWSPTACNPSLSTKEPEAVTLGAIAGRRIDPQHIANAIYNH